MCALNEDGVRAIAEALTGLTTAVEGLRTAVAAIQKVLETTTEQRPAETGHEPEPKPVKKARAQKSQGHEPKPEVDTPEEPSITLEQVRKTLVGLSRKGWTDEIRGILADVGAEKLSDTTPEQWPEIMRRAKLLR